MRRISFAITMPPVFVGQKTVTRRKGWKHVKVGEELRAVDRAMSFPSRNDPPPVLFGTVELVGLRREPLTVVTDEDAIREGFPRLNRDGFLAMYRAAFPGVERVTRIEFVYKPWGAIPPLGTTVETRLGMGVVLAQVGQPDSGERVLRLVETHLGLSHISPRSVVCKDAAAVVLTTNGVLMVEHAADLGPLPWGESAASLVGRFTREPDIREMMEAMEAGDV